MAYKYREVKCPACKHIFMCNKDEDELLAIYEYRLKATGEMIYRAKCPACGKEMAVLNHAIDGIEIDDRVEKIGIRGI